MFSGIVEGAATLLSSIQDKGIVRLNLEMPFDPTDVKRGDSICVSGVCLTAIDIEGRVLSFEVMPETIKRTSLGSVQIGGKLNVERSLQVGGRVHGHFVFGHIDGVSKLVSRTENCGSVDFIFSIPEGLRKYFAHKGSVCINGVSLTLGEITKDTFMVYLIPHTLTVTTLGQLRVGDVANIEVDMLARYAFGEA
jgi:riboflavin synthase